MAQVLTNFFAQFREVLLSYNPLTDTLDILLVTFMIYGLLKQLRKTQSIQVIKGIFLIALLYVVVVALKMQTSRYIFEKIFSDIFIFLVIIFSNEIRQALEHFGQSRFSRISIFGPSRSEDETIDAINAVCRACASMSRAKTGSLIVFQRNSFLGDLEKMSVPIDAVTTPDLLCGIFYPNSALHDGAIVIKDGRIVAARCVVPLRNDREVTEHVGTRHRAALEVSAHSDAVVVVTSEETGIISVAVDGQLIRGITDSELREKLGGLLLNDEEGSQRVRSRIFRGRGKK